MILQQIIFPEPVEHDSVWVDCLLVFLNLKDLSGLCLRKKKKRQSDKEI